MNVATWQDAGVLIGRVLVHASSAFELILDSRKSKQKR